MKQVVVFIIVIACYKILYLFTTLLYQLYLTSSYFLSILLFLVHFQEAVLVSFK